MYKLIITITTTILITTIIQCLTVQTLRCFLRDKCKTRKDFSSSNTFIISNNSNSSNFMLMGLILTLTSNQQCN